MRKSRHWSEPMRMEDGDPIHLNEAIRNLDEAIADPRNADMIRQLEEAKQQLIAARIENYFPISATIPYLNRAGVEGEVTWREWTLWKHGIREQFLCSITAGTPWRSSQLFADILPSQYNKSGVYSRALNAYGIKSLPGYFHTKAVAKDIFGFVEIRGKAVHHADGVVRSEYARMLHLIIPTGPSAMKGTYQTLTESYPNVQVSILNPSQLYEMIFREAVIEFIRWHPSELSHIGGLWQ